jgi:hypothetical protein
MTLGACSDSSASPAPRGDGDAGGVAPDGGTSSCHADPAPSPELVASSAFDADTIARAAVVIGSTMPDDGIARNLAHLWNTAFAEPQFYYRLALQADCFAHANCGNAAPAHCAGYTITSHAPDDCHTGCNDDVFTACGPDQGLVAGAAAIIDCGKVGERCDPNAVCVAEAAETCTPDSFAGTCSDDGRPARCSQGVVIHGARCGDFGLACDGNQCVGKGAECGEAGSGATSVIPFVPVSCADDVLETCVNGHAASEPCSTFGPGFTCQSVDGKPFCGLASDCAPTDENGDSSTDPLACDGTVITLCNQGRLEHIDCKTLGFEGCDLDKSVGHYGCIPGLEL